MAAEYRFWTAPQRKIVVENYRTKGAPWCAEKTGKPLRSVRAFAMRNGVSARRETLAHPSTPAIDAVILSRHRVAERRAA